MDKSSISFNQHKTDKSPRISGVNPWKLCKMMPPSIHTSSTTAGTGSSTRSGRSGGGGGCAGRVGCVGGVGGVASLETFVAGTVEVGKWGGMGRSWVNVAMISHDPLILKVYQNHSNYCTVLGIMMSVWNFDLHCYTHQTGVLYILWEFNIAMDNHHFQWENPL